MTSSSPALSPRHLLDDEESTDSLPFYSTSRQSVIIFLIFITTYFFAFLLVANVPFVRRVFLHLVRRATVTVSPIEGVKVPVGESVTVTLPEVPATGLPASASGSRATRPDIADAHKDFAFYFEIPRRAPTLRRRRRRCTVSVSLCPATASQHTSPLSTPQRRFRSPRLSYWSTSPKKRRFLSVPSSPSRTDGAHSSATASRVSNQSETPRPRSRRPSAALDGFALPRAAATTSKTSPSSHLTPASPTKRRRINQTRGGGCLFQIVEHSTMQRVASSALVTGSHGRTHRAEISHRDVHTGAYLLSVRNAASLPHAHTHAASSHANRLSSSTTSHAHTRSVSHTHSASSMYGRRHDPSRSRRVNYSQMSNQNSQSLSNPTSRRSLSASLSSTVSDFSSSPSYLSALKSKMRTLPFISPPDLPKPTENLTTGGASLSSSLVRFNSGYSVGAQNHHSNPSGTGGSIFNALRRNSRSNAGATSGGSEHATSAGGALASSTGRNLTAPRPRRMHSRGAPDAFCQRKVDTSKEGEGSAKLVSRVDYLSRPSGLAGFVHNVSKHLPYSRPISPAVSMFDSPQNPNDSFAPENTDDPMVSRPVTPMPPPSVSSAPVTDGDVTAGPDASAGAHEPAAASAGAGDDELMPLHHGRGISRRCLDEEGGDDNVSLSPSFHPQDVVLDPSKTYGVEGGMTLTIFVSLDEHPRSIHKEFGLYGYFLCAFVLAIGFSWLTALLLTMAVTCENLQMHWLFYWLNDEFVSICWDLLVFASSFTVFVVLPFSYFWAEAEGMWKSRGVFTGKCFEAFVTLVFYNASLFGGYHLLHSMFRATSIFTHPAVSMMTLLVHTVPGLVLVLRHSRAGAYSLIYGASLIWRPSRDPSLAQQLDNFVVDRTNARYIVKTAEDGLRDLSFAELSDLRVELDRLAKAIDDIKQRLAITRRQLVLGNALSVILVSVGALLSWYAVCRVTLTVGTYFTPTFVTSMFRYLGLHRPLANNASALGGGNGGDELFVVAYMRELLFPRRVAYASALSFELLTSVRASSHAVLPPVIVLIRDVAIVWYLLFSTVFDLFSRRSISMSRLQGLLVNAGVLLFVCSSFPFAVSVLGIASFDIKDFYAETASVAEVPRIVYGAVFLFTWLLRFYAPFLQIWRLVWPPVCHVCQFVLTAIGQIAVRLYMAWTFVGEKLRYLRSLASSLRGRILQRARDHAHDE